ncbi:c2 calcium-dependent membrane targeting [Anaeramoeba flamelloides]|uniref:C2 calcium-dependent membrane targeting n=1 Tax=Anaeramoeba flamelloides TaxID=1746091 RepID=A0ABQ8Y276_9EUKA|nr:c2 calcium-dependent membrane targeting [Anaeramoeba flamelloides]
MPAVPKWYKLYTDEPDNTFGEILASFQLIRARKVKNTPLPDLTPKHKECIIEISSVGLRNLLPYRMQKIKNPYIRIRLRAMIPKRKKKKTKEKSKNHQTKQSKNRHQKGQAQEPGPGKEDQKKETETEKEKEKEERNNH